MKIIREKSWNYTIYENDNGEVYLEVLCGTSALYEIKILLSKDTFEKILKDEQYIDKLVEEIRYSPHKFLSKKLI
jgi:hypothetical protein